MAHKRDPSRAMMRPKTEAEQIFWTSVYLTVVFSAVAITRKTYVRLYFNKKQLKKEANKT